MSAIEWMLICLAAGCVGGFLSGLLGVGGGIVFIPLVTTFLSVNHAVPSDVVSYTLANSLVVVFAVGISGSYKQAKTGNFFLPQILATAFPAIVSSLVLSYLIKTGTWFDKHVYTYVFLSLLLFILFRMLVSLLRRKYKQEEYDTPPAYNKFLLPGFFTGFITAASGLGGGIVMVPYFNKIFKLKMQKATAISLGVIPFLAFPLLLFYAFETPVKSIEGMYQTGYIIWNITLPLVLGAITLSSLGVRTAQRISSNAVAVIFSCFVAATALKMILELL